MGGCRCSYKNCIRATKNSEKDFHFFHYPVKDPERCLKWINNAKKPNFQNLPEDQLRNKVVCQLHFEQNYFTNAFRKRLIHNAIPTVDAGSEEVPKGDELQVQVLQSDSEGNVFTVDTENYMQTEVRDITSYVIQNGNLVPADQPNTEIIKPMIYKFSVSERMEEDIENNIEDNNGQEFLATTNINFNTSLKNPKTFITGRDQWPEGNELSIPIYELRDNSRVEMENVVDLNPEENDFIETREGIVLDDVNNEDCNTLEVVHLSKTIQKHSKEIACLKRILKSKMKKSRCRKRLTNTQVINSLRGILPATLHAAVSLHLHKKEDNFTKDERNFLTILYKASPAAYEILLKDCKWKLPSSDTVKKLISNRNCVR